MQKALAFICICAIASIGQVEIAVAQHWRQISDLRSYFPPVVFGGALVNVHVTAIDFWDEKNGLIALSTFYPSVTSNVDSLIWGTPAEILRTTDQGNTWIVAKTPPPPLSEVSLNDIYMIDSLHGFAASNMYIDPPGAYISPGAVWKTNDGGLSWSIIDSNRACTGIRPLEGGRFAAAGGGAAIKDSATAMITPAFPSALGKKSSFAAYTTDGGKSWTAGSTKILESWGAYYNVANDRFYICPESAYPGSLKSGFLYSSSDLGNTWIALPGLPAGFQPTGALAGIGNIIYVQSLVSASNTGIWRSRDGGETFEPVGGPSSVWDTRISVPPLL